MTAARSILIVGASARAAAQSATRAAWQPSLIDLFNDVDTAELGPTFQCPFGDYPHGFVELAKQAPPGPWMYTGGLENYPEVVKAIARDRELFGVSPEVLIRIRNPFELAKMVRMPRIDEPPGLSRWSSPAPGTHRGQPCGSLLKPLRGAGGVGIRFAEENEIASEGFYFQEFLPGASYSALFLFPGNGPPELLGICAQLVGELRLNAPPFQYCGNIGPLPVDSGLTAELSDIGLSLASFDLRGLIGVDFLLVDRDVFVLEVNPRYTASVELYERATGRALLAEHIDCFRTSPTEPRSEAKRGDRTIPGKAILYAARDFLVRDDHPWRGPRYADIPRVGSAISAGQPVVTVFAAGDTEPECRERLLELAQRSAHP